MLRWSAWDCTVSLSQSLMAAAANDQGGGGGGGGRHEAAPSIFLPPGSAGPCTAGGAGVGTSRSPSDCAGSAVGSGVVAGRGRSMAGMAGSRPRLLPPCGPLRCGESLGPLPAGPGGLRWGAASFPGGGGGHPYLFHVARIWRGGLRRRPGSPVEEFCKLNTFTVESRQGIDMPFSPR